MSTWFIVLLVPVVMAVFFLGMAVDASLRRADVSDETEENVEEQPVKQEKEVIETGVAARNEMTADWMVRWTAVEDGLPSAGKAFMVSVTRADNGKKLISIARYDGNGGWSVDKTGKVDAWAAVPRYIPRKHPLTK